jgi:hypothetical protein
MPGRVGPLAARRVRLDSNRVNLAKLFAMFRAYRAGAPLGDVVVLKLDALHAAPKDVAAKLVAVRGYAPRAGDPRAPRFTRSRHL